MTNTNDFLPQDYEAPKNGGNYMKLQKGENRFRILAKPILGWLDWKDNKPLRFRMPSKPNPIDPKKPVRHFWAMIVFDCIEEKIKILEITQSTIQGAIQNLSKDADWGSPMGYDIKIVKSGEGMETEYAVNPVPHKPIPDLAKKLLAEQSINLEALYDGADPFGEKKSVPVTHDLPF